MVDPNGRAEFPQLSIDVAAKSLAIDTLDAIARSYPDDADTQRACAREVARILARGTLGLLEGARGARGRAR